jgi:hypothetical protein
MRTFEGLLYNGIDSWETGTFRNFLEHWRPSGRTLTVGEHWIASGDLQGKHGRQETVGENMDRRGRPSERTWTVGGRSSGRTWTVGGRSSGRSSGSDSGTVSGTSGVTLCIALCISKKLLGVFLDLFI